MLVSCVNCQKSYNLPDAKLPFGKVINFSCPACKATIELDLRNPPEENAGSEKLVFKPISEETESALTITEIKKKIIKRIDDLPPMPKVLFKARAVLSDMNSSFKDISAIIETDQAIAAKILKVANSAYYGLSGMVSSIHQASVVLGYQTLEQVITMVSTSSLLGKQLRGYQLSAGVLWRHSLAVALASKYIAQKRAPSIESDAFSVGLIHDAGKLALDPYVLKKRNEIDRFLRDENPSFIWRSARYLDSTTRRLPKISAINGSCRKIMAMRCVFITIRPRPKIINWRILFMSPTTSRLRPDMAAAQASTPIP